MELLDQLAWVQISMLLRVNNVDSGPPIVIVLCAAVFVCESDLTSTSGEKNCTFMSYAEGPMCFFLVITPIA